MANKVTTIFNNQKSLLEIELLSLRKKFIPKELIEYVIDRKDSENEVYKIILKAKNKEDFYNQLREYFRNAKNKYILEDLVFIKSIGFTITNIKHIPANIAIEVFKNNTSIRELLSLYKSELVTFINKNKIYKNNILNRSVSENGAAKSDFTIPFTEPEYDVICQNLFLPTNKYPKGKTDRETFDIYQTISRNASVLKDILVMIFSLYDKDTLMHNKEFVSFEMNYGYTEKYYKLLYNQQPIPSLEERKQIYLQEKNISQEEQYYLTQLDLIEERIYTLSSSTKELMIQKIQLIRQEKDIVKKAKLVKEVYEYYEREYRKEIVASLYTPTSSTEVKDIDELKPLLLHVFIRDPYKMGEGKETEIRDEIASRRGIKVTKVEELTEEEQLEYHRRLKELKEELLNPVVTHKYLDEPSFYSDKNGWRWYKSNTSKQISTSLIGYEALMSMSNCVGVGFSSESIDPDNIIMSSNQYQTTNMGVDNLEISRENQFHEKSAPLQELLASRLTEVVLYRSKDGKDTKSAYVFAVISGLRPEEDQKVVEQARQYAEDNKIKLIVFNQHLIRQSYEQKYGQKKEQ